MVVVQFLSCVWLFATPSELQASLSFTIYQSLFKLLSIEPVMPSNRLILCCPLLLLPSAFPSIRVFRSESAFHIRWPKHWSFSFSISPSNEYSGLISFRMGWSDLLAVQGTLKALLQPRLKSIRFYALSLLYGLVLTSVCETGKLALTLWIFVAKWCLHFLIHCRFVVAFPPGASIF